jgi:hypothetical protein
MWWARSSSDRAGVVPKCFNGGGGRFNDNVWVRFLMLFRAKFLGFHTLLAMGWLLSWKIFLSLHYYFMN